MIGANLISAAENAAAVSADIANEISKQRRHGPFDEPPFPNFFRANPLGVVFKKGKLKPRLIHHLSWPRSGDNVNKFVSQFDITLNAFDKAVASLTLLGAGTYIAKIDIDAAYRCIPVRPADWPILGLQWDSKFYFDSVMQFGLASATAIFEWYSSAAEFIARKLLPVSALTHYVDDFLLMHKSKEQCAKLLDLLLRLFKELGLPVSPSKIELAAQLMVFLGILFNSINMTISLHESRVKDIESMLDEWMNKTSASRNELQSLIGVLSFASKVVPSSRVFLRRMIDQCKSIPFTAAATTRYPLTPSFFADVQWWTQFIRCHNGKTIARSCLTRASLHIHTDACVTRYAAVTNKSWYACTWSDAEEATARRLKRDSMPWKELYAIAKALATFSVNNRGMRIVIHSDCEPVIQAWQRGDSRKTEMANIIRTMLFICATNDIDMQIEFIAGVDNVFADLLSRGQINRFMELRQQQDRSPITCLPLPIHTW